MALGKFEQPDKKRKVVNSAEPMILEKRQKFFIRI